MTAENSLQSLQMFPHKRYCTHFNMQLKWMLRNYTNKGTLKAA